MRVNSVWIDFPGECYLCGNAASGSGAGEKRF